MHDLVPHPLNWVAGWWLLLAAFGSGALLGLFFHRPGFLGGYDAFPRRVLRLGHISLAVIGMLNLLYGLSPLPFPGSPRALAAGWLWLFTGAAMPAVCFLSAWKEPLRRLFPLPVLAMVLAVLCTVL